MRISAAVRGAPAVVAMWLAGCASPGVPHPPSLRLPEKATNLQAHRIGAEVRISWVTSGNTTDGDAIRAGISAAICRQIGPGACVPLRQIAVQPGRTEIADKLPGPLRVGADSLLTYRVELKNDAGRSAGLSDAAYALGGRAPEPPAGVTATPRREGVLVTWQPEQGGAAGDAVELRKTGSSGSGTRTKRKTINMPFAGKKPGTGGGGRVLVADGAEDAHGMLDGEVRDGETYTYVAERVRRVRVAGQALELRSTPAAPVVITYRNVLPPQPPTGLATVPGGGFGSAPSIDLSWQANDDPDVQGYSIYRAMDGGAAVRLTDAPVQGTSYRDSKVAAGHRYVYQVTALDTEGNESGRSAEAKETLR